MNKRLKPFELSLWKDKLVHVDDTNLRDYINIYKGLDLDRDDLSFWYFPCRWDETYKTNNENLSHSISLQMGSTTGASKYLQSDFITNTDFLKPNTTYSILLEMDFDTTNGNYLPDFNKFKITYPNLQEFSVVSLTQNIGVLSDNSFKTAFDSDIIINYNGINFNINDSILVNDDKCVLLQYDDNTIKKIYCVCKITTNNFIKDQSTVGLWTVFNCFKTGTWKSDVRLLIFENSNNSDFYQDVISELNISTNTYISRLNNRNNLGLLNNETILGIFQNQIKNQIGTLTNNSTVKIEEKIFNDCIEELLSVLSLRRNTDISQLSTSEQNILLEECYMVINKFFPFVPQYSQKNFSDMYKIKEYQKVNNSGPFSNFFDGNYTANNSFKYAIKQLNDGYRSPFKNCIYEYIKTIIACSYIVEDNGYKFSVNNSIIIFLLLQMMSFFINNNKQLLKIFNILVKTINANKKQKNSFNNGIESYSLSEYSLGVYIMGLLYTLNDNITTLNTTIDNIYINDASNVVYMNYITLENNKLIVNNGATPNKKAMYVLKKITFMGTPRMGLFNGTNSIISSYVGIWPWINPKEINNGSYIFYNNDITFYDMINLFNEPIIINDNSSMDDLINNYEDKSETYYLQDYKVCVLGTEKDNQKNMAQDIQFCRSEKNITTLTFSLYTNYFDREYGNYVANDYVKLLTNESKLRLYYEDNWYDFIITNIQEDLLVEHKIIYTAEDANVLELSKIGFNKTFNTELDNNIGTINELTEKTLSGTSWKLDSERTCLLQQFSEQPVFVGYLNSNIDIESNTLSSLEQNTIIFLFYNEIINELNNSELHILYYLDPITTTVKHDNNSDFISEIDNLLKGKTINNLLKDYEEGIINYNNWEYENININSYKKPSFLNNMKLLFSIRANQLVKKPKMHFNKALNRYVYEYKYSNSNDVNNNTIYYGYEKKEYDTDKLVLNLLPNGQDFISIDNWYVINPNEIPKTSLDLNITENNFIVEDGVNDNEIYYTDNNYSFLTFETELYNSNNTPQGFIFNTDLTYNFNNLDHLNVNDEFVLRLQIERGIDKSLGINSGTTYQDDQIVLLEALKPALYTYDSIEKVQSLGFSALTETNQLINFWNASMIEQNNSKIANSFTRSNNGSLVPIYWDREETKDESGIVANKLGLPLFYTWEATAKYWLANNYIKNNDDGNQYIKSKKFYLTNNSDTGGKANLERYLLDPNSSDFNFVDFPIVSEAFVSNLIPNNYNTRIFNSTKENNNFIFKYVNNNYNNGDTYKDIKYYVLLEYLNLNNYNNLEEIESYTYNRETGLFEPNNINIEGINVGEKEISGLPMGQNNYYDDFDIIMRSRAIWRPIKYNTFKTCVFETEGKYKGNPYYTSNSTYNFNKINYEYGDLLSKNIGLFFFIEPTLYSDTAVTNATAKMAISKVELFRKYTDENNNIISPSDILNANIKTIYRLYDPELIENKTALKESDLKWHYEEYYLDEHYTKVIDENGTKINSITITESNIYNILQKLGEIFGAWLHINVEHDPITGATVGITGKNNILPIKKVYFTDAEYHTVNLAGIKYGINLKNIQRQIDSTDIINKLIVKNNNNEYAELGFASIINSNFNVSGSTSIFNFDYYIHQNILDNSIYAFLYENIYPKTYIIGRTLTKISKEKVKLKNKLLQSQASFDFYKVGCDNILTNIADYNDRFYGLCGYDYSIYAAYPRCFKDSNHPLYTYRNNKQLLSYINKINYYKKLLTSYKSRLANEENNILKLNSQLTIYEDQSTGLIYQRDYLLQKVFDIYSSYIKEGSWISEDYLDDDLYYIDSEKKLSEVSKPKITYTIEVVDISNLPEFSDYQFNLQDKTYIEDVEIFGYNENGTPYKEEIIVTELKNYLRSPEKNTITVQNYKTQFDDLFQRISNTIQAVEFGTGNYSNMNNSLLKNKILNNEI